ncbi:TetR family transcriptional regulator [Streptomyces tateyamensis]|uniref:TetR family transcriptional regulator n=1 Tax=Streptomyces tateyamensis TaxID=565073 RepID=A0A2V4NI92_9ACTN|nr:TetR/AcrR family transcriptional regulator [Streptomyces tateyamensis]PYC66658.1 TetR family transcriptional regulator [Streptomyces tateyamensis]
MSRWEPNARERLQQAALDLFVERGYESTAVAEIAERAGLAKSTFFRHFRDKREVLFGGGELLGELFTTGVAQAPGDATPLAMVGAALEAVQAAFPAERRDWVRQRTAVVQANDELRERELLKAASLVEVLVRALRERGVAEPVARLAAALGYQAFPAALARWTEPGERREFAELARQELARLHAAVAKLG